MLKLIQVSVRIRIINQLVQKLESLPNGHFLFAELKKFISFGLHKIICLISMIQAVEFANRIPGGSLVIPECFFFFRFYWGTLFRISLQYILFPFIQTAQGCNFGLRKSFQI